MAKLLKKRSDTNKWYNMSIEKPEEDILSTKILSMDQEELVDGVVWEHDDNRFPGTGLVVDMSFNKKE